MRGTPLILRPALLLLVALSPSWALAQTETEALPTDVAGCLNEASQARTRNDIEHERRVLEHAETLKGLDHEHAEVQKQLARIDWRYYERFDEARERLTRAGKGPEPTTAWLTLVELEWQQEDYEAAEAAARRAQKSADSGFLRHSAQLALHETTMRRVRDRRRAGELATDLLSPEIVADLRETVSAEFGHLETSRILLQSALLLDDGEAALLGWHSYFQIAPDHALPNAIARAGEALQKILPGWDGPGATTEARIRLIEALGGSRLFEEAELVALDPRGAEAVREHPRVRELVAYSRTIRKLQERADEFYRRLALGETRNSTLDRTLSRAWRELWPELDDPSSKNPPTGKKLLAELTRRFGTDYTVGLTGGFYSLHMGHIVIDETKTIEQYGYSGDMRFVCLDTMVSNGFWSWVRGGHSTGGWAKPGAMWQVRPSFASESLNAWRELHSEKEREQFEAKLLAESRRDDDRARKDPHAYLPGLRMRLTKQAVVGVLGKLEKTGHSGDDLRKAFIAHVDLAYQESSIFAHEGRHVIDKIVPSRFRPTNPEYTAKLSEVAFASEPRFALSNLVSPNIGSPTNHGKANLRVMKGIVRWMEANRGEIAKLDPERPLLPQADLLTDDQIRHLFRWLDPLAKGT